MSGTIDLEALCHEKGLTRSASPFDIVSAATVHKQARARPACRQAQPFLRRPPPRPLVPRPISFASARRFSA